MRVGLTIGAAVLLLIGGVLFSAGSASGPAEERTSIRQIDPEREAEGEGKTIKPDLESELDDDVVIGPAVPPGGEPSTDHRELVPALTVAITTAGPAPSDSDSEYDDRWAAPPFPISNVGTPVEVLPPSGPVLGPAPLPVPGPSGGPRGEEPSDGEPSAPNPWPYTLPGPGPYIEPRSSDPLPPPPPLDLDQANCPNLGLVAIGDAPDGDEALASFHQVFRAHAAAELTKPMLVCAEPIQRWQDMVFQRLIVEGRPEAVLVTAADHSSPVLKLHLSEWEVWGFREAEAGNLLGFPLERTRLEGAEVVLSTSGALVMAHDGTKPIPLVGGIWELWLSTGGANGPMGMPESYPYGSQWVSSTTGLSVIGALQEFSHGWAGLPDVSTPLEAAAQPMEAYEWHPSTATVDPASLYGNILEIANTHVTYYLDHDGVRHWISTSSDWMCATWDLGAQTITVSGFEAGRFPIGETFVCPG